MLTITAFFLVQSSLLQPVQTQRPIGRHHHAIAYDEARDRIVAFAGNGDDAVFFSDLWERHEGNWSMVPQTGPGPRASHVVVYDPVSRTTLVFGGIDSDGYVDTLEERPTRLLTVRS